MPSQKEEKDPKRYTDEYKTKEEEYEELVRRSQKTIVVRTPDGTPVERPKKRHQTKTRENGEAEVSMKSDKNSRKTKRLTSAERQVDPVIVVRTPDGTRVPPPKGWPGTENVDYGNQKRSGIWPQYWLNHMSELPKKFFPKSGSQQPSKTKPKRQTHADPDSMDIGCKPRRNRTRSVDSTDSMPQMILRRMGLNKEKRTATKNAQKPKKHKTVEESPVVEKSTHDQQKKSEPEPENNNERGRSLKRSKETVAESLMQSFRTIRRKSRDKFTKVKIFVSRPIREKGMQKLLERISRRPKRISTAGLHQGDDVFPIQKKDSDSTQSTSSRSSSSRKEITPKEKKPTKKKIEKTETEEQNDGNSPIFRNGRPFWQQNRKGDEKELVEEDSMTDDELPMNAEVLVEVNSGQRTLKEMPRIPVKLDPYCELQHLENRDDDFFTPEIIFSNTIRTMINLVDEDTKTTSDNADASKVMPPQLDIHEPDHIFLYDLSKPHIGGFAVDRNSKK